MKKEEGRRKKEEGRRKEGRKNGWGLKPRPIVNTAGDSGVLNPK
ncbi:hypothetical protein [Okeania sp. SIO1I7]|nr:hypothetical protein [Okeania sp. SIO1I7]